MKCVNCGASLETDRLRQVKFCPYCGAEIEMEEETPTTLAGAVHGIAKSFFSQTADKIRYNREHAAEIAELKRKEKREEEKRALRMMAYMMAGLVAMLAAAMLIGKIIGWF